MQDVISLSGLVSRNYFMNEMKVTYGSIVYNSFILCNKYSMITVKQSRVFYKLNLVLMTDNLL